MGKKAFTDVKDNQETCLPLTRMNLNCKLKKATAIKTFFLQIYFCVLLYRHLTNCRAWFLSTEESE